MSPTQEQAKELFDYDPKTGDLVWDARTSNCIKIGDVAGCMNSNGYISVGIGGKLYYAHRIVWLWHHGFLPENHLDHINCDKKDNRIENLREASYSCNRINCGNNSNNKPGVRGVYFHKQDNKWVSKITTMNKTKHIGRYDDFDEAVLARLAAEQCLGWEGCDSSSPAYLYAIRNKLIRNLDA